MTRLEGMLGLASRAGQITLGAELVLNQIRAGAAALVLLDEGASEGTKKKIADACAYRDVEMHILPMGMLARACGRADRMAGALKKGPMCRRLQELLTLSGKPDEP